MQIIKIFKGFIVGSLIGAVSAVAIVCLINWSAFRFGFFYDWILGLDLVLVILIPLFFIFTTKQWLQISRGWIIFFYFASIAIIICIIAYTNIIVTHSPIRTTSSAVLSDVRQLASALELYFNDNHSYPQNLNLLVPTYIGRLPQTQYSKLSECSSKDPIVRYTKNSADSFILEFCLEEKTSVYQKGINWLTQDGIK